MVYSNRFWINSMVYSNSFCLNGHRRDDSNLKYLTTKKASTRVDPLFLDIADVSFLYVPIKREAPESYFFRERVSRREWVWVWFLLKFNPTTANFKNPVFT
jgi:hypothetical protein